MIFGAFERLVAFRYLRARRAEGFISVIAGFSLLGIALGVGTLIVVMSVMNGFRAEFLKQILGFNGDLTVYARETGGTLPNYEDLVKAILAVPGVTAAAPMVERPVVASVSGDWTGIQIRGVAQEDLLKQADLANHIVAGSIQALDPNSIMIGWRLAQKMGLQIGSHLSLISPQGTTTAFGTVPRVKSYVVAAIYDTGSQYDSAYGFLTLAAAQTFFQVPQAATGIQIWVDDRENLWRYRGAVGGAAGPTARLYDWQTGNNAFLEAVKTERNVMFLILTMIIVVASFNVISSMIMLVRSKGRDIAILRTMGATRGMILRVFFLAGASIGIVGTLLGDLLGLGFALNIERIRQFLQSLTGTDLFSEEIYFLAHMPAKVEPGEVLTVTLMAFGLSFLATLYPSWRAARLDPVEALRYE
jgi:lipoprotein-releasing system permease protein